MASRVIICRNCGPVEICVSCNDVGCPICDTVLIKKEESHICDCSKHNGGDDDDQAGTCQSNECR